MVVCPTLLRLVLVYILVVGIRGKSSKVSNLPPVMPYVVDTTICKTTPGLTRTQLELCYKQPDVTAVAVNALGLAVHECQYQFQKHRWNCSSLDTKSKNPYTSAIFQKGFRETAFGHAISTAAVVINVARACSQNRLLSCSCVTNKNRKKKIKGPKNENEVDWKWGSCSDNIHYGMKFSKMFLDKREKGSDIHSKVNLHNNQVGRQAVSKNVQVRCKCHGMSGSCNLKTCWRSVPELRQVGNVLKEKYKSAAMVDQTNLSSDNFKLSNSASPPKQRKNKNKNRTRLKPKKASQENLIFYQKSPNFCDRDASLDIAGTVGRVCNKTSTDQDECTSLCCDRGHNPILRKRIEKDCKFVWCCNVECKNRIIEEYVTVCN